MESNSIVAVQIRSIRLYFRSVRDSVY